VHFISYKLVIIYYANCFIDFKGNLDECSNRQLIIGITKRSTLKFKKEYVYNLKNDNHRIKKKINYNNSNGNLNFSIGSKKEKDN
jgi:hypothetical protein